jgi:hypothetical protein
MAVLLSVSLFLIGCPTDSDEDDGGQETPPVNTEDKDPVVIATTDDLAAARTKIASASTGKLPLHIATGVSFAATDGLEVVDFLDTEVTILGTLNTSGAGKVVVVAAKATVTLAEGATVTLDTDDLFIKSNAADGDDSLTTAGFVDGASESELANFVGTVTAVENLTLASSAVTYPADLVIYVYGTLDVATGAAAPVFSGTGKIVAIDKVTVAGTVENALANAAKVDVSKAQISVKSSGTAEITLPAAISGYRFHLSGAQEVLTVKGSADISAYVVAGNGVLKFAEAVTKAVITGYGKIEFTKDDAPLALTAGSSIATGDSGYVYFAKGISPVADLTLDGTVILANATTVTLGTAALTLNDGTTVAVGTTAAFNELFSANGDVTLTGVGATLAAVAKTGTVAQKLVVATAAITVAGDVSFEGDLLLSGVGATFGGKTIFAEDAVVTLTDASSVISLGPQAVLGIPATQPAWGYILGNSDASAPVTLTPTADGATLTFAAGRILTQGIYSTSTAHDLTVDGKAALYAGATYTVASEASKVGTLTVDNAATFTLAAGVLGGDTFDDNSAKIVLTGASGSDSASIAGAGTVVAGATTITGGADNGWRAVGTGTIAIGADTITGSGGAIALTATTAGNNGVIAVAAVENTAATLTVTTASIDINTGGNVTLAGNATGLVTATLVLKGAASNAAALVIDSSGSGQTVATVGAGKLDIGDTGGTTNPAEIKVNGASINTGNSNIGDVTITAATDDATTATAALTFTAGDTPSDDDLQIVSSTDVSTKTTIVKGNEILASN